MWKIHKEESFDLGFAIGYLFSKAINPSVMVCAIKELLNNIAIKRVFNFFIF